MARNNGIILLGYARSAGSGDQAVPGVVTSRRDRGQQQRQKQKAAQQQEEERKLRQRQEVAAQYLKKKWKEEDDKRKGKHIDKGDDDDEEEADDDSGMEAEMARGGQQDRSAADPPEGKWVSVEEAKKQLHQVDMHTIEPPQMSSHAGSAPPGFRSAAPKPLVTMDPATQQKRKKALASAFGLDDDDGEARRELELAARIKRQRVDTARPTGDSMAAGSGAALPAPTLGKPGGDNMYDQLRKLAEWKRKCKGNRVPMPDDLVASIGGTAGINLTPGFNTLGSKERPENVRPVAFSPSRSPSGQRRYVERKRSRSTKGRRRSRSKSRGKRSKETRAVL